VKPLPPGPRGRRLLGSLLEIRRDRLRFVSHAAREYGDIVFFRMGPIRRLYLLSHPDPIHHVLNGNPGNYVKGVGLEQARMVLGEGILTSEGELWAAQRENLHRFFGHNRLEAYAGLIVESAEEMIRRWHRTAGTGQPVDVGRETVRLTLDVLGRTLLGTNLNGLGDRLTPALDEVARWSMRRMAGILPLPVFVPTPQNLRCRRAVRDLEAIAGEILERRSKAPEKDDFLSALLMSQKRERGEEGRKLLRRELLSVLLAGHETTASALSWCCHLLATHPETQRLVREEVLRALPERTLPAAAALPRLPYTRMVLEETLRLYPPVWMITRRAIAEDTVCGYEVPAGSDMLISIYNLHRHPRLWDDPEEFRPERFAADQARGRPSGAYLPFGTGARACLGRGLSFLETVLAMALIVRAFELSPAPGQPVEPEPLLTLRPRNSLLQRLAPLRADGPAERSRNTAAFSHAPRARA
jgi:cytochrome P450